MIGKPPRNARAAIALLLATHAALLAWAATRHSPSIDEVGHIAAGLSHWRFGRFDLYSVNPPLVRMAACAPVALLHPQAEWSGYSLLPGARGEFECGEQFIAANGRNSFWMFTLARWACVPFSLLGGYICYQWARELYGTAGGLLALSLWCFSPNILAHGQMITPDVGAASMGIAACYLFWRWLRNPVWRRALVAGIVLGFAELTKTTFLAYYPVWLAAYVVWSVAGMRRQQAFAAKQPAGFDASQESEAANSASKRGPYLGRCDAWQAAQFAVMSLLSVYVLNIGYAFEGSFHPLGKYHFISEALGGPRDAKEPNSFHRNRFASTAISGLRVPLPANYLLGIDSQKFDFEVGYDSYLRGEWRRGGWWYYYLYGLAVKVPLGVWGLLLMATFVGRAAPTVCDSPSDGTTFNGATWRDEFVLLFPAAAILILVSSQTGFNHHLRYVLPIFPAAFIWTGRLGRLWGDCGVSPRRLLGLPIAAPRATALVAFALAWSVGSSLWYYPHNLSYFNELVGGPLGGRWHLIDSNLDWGQDLLYLKRWLDRHPEAKPLSLAYFGKFDPRTAGVEFSIPPLGMAEDEIPLDSSGPRPGWYAVSVMMLHGAKYYIPDGKGALFYANRPYFTYFQHFTPVARAGYSIYIYHIDRQAADRLRKLLKLPSLEDEVESNMGSGSGFMLR